MKYTRIIGCLLMIFIMITSSKSQEINFANELLQMVSTDHFWESKDFGTYQYSSFCREGNNPDDVGFLYQEEGWYVYTDCSGPGVVTRIWSTFRPRRGWGNMKVELDGEVIYEGDSKHFFEMGMPFANPISKIERGATGICYVPLPFKNRFRFMLDVQNYNIVNVKLFDSSVEIKSFNSRLTDKEKEAWNIVAGIFNDNHYFLNSLDSFQRFNKKFKISSGKSGEIKYNGPGIIRGIIIESDSATMAGLNMKIYWDNESKPSIDVPVELGFGSNRHNNLLLGSSDKGKYFCIPMPFKKSGRIAFTNNSDKKLTFSAMVYTENANLNGSEIFYLRANANEGKYILGQSVPKAPEAPLNEYFYQNGYLVLETSGKGHLIAYMDYFTCQPELDEHIFIDEKNNFPNNRWNGTGHEDMFDMSWGHKNKSSFYISGGSQFGAEVNVRVFWNAPITWEEEIKFLWEWTPNIYKNPNRDAIFSSVVYFYQ